MKLPANTQNSFNKKNSAATGHQASHLEARSVGSPRSTLSKQSRVRRQRQRLFEMKNEAKAQLAGLPTFQLMFWSKLKLSEASSDSDILGQLTSRFGPSLPLKHFDLVLVSDLTVEPEPVAVEEEVVEDVGSKVGSHGGHKSSTK